jgi:hypothetical protein
MRIASFMVQVDLSTSGQELSSGASPRFPNLQTASSAFDFVSMKSPFTFPIDDPVSLSNLG